MEEEIVDPVSNGIMEYTLSSGSEGSDSDSTSDSDSDIQVLPSPANFAYKLTNALNIIAKPPPGSLPHPQVTNNPCGQNIKITCLMCCNLIFQRMQPLAENDEEKERRSKLIKNLCDELHLNKFEIPDLCVKEEFPFCRMCREKVEKLWNLKAEIAKLQQDMITTRKDIQTSVVAGEIKKEPKIKKPKHPLVLEAEARKFTRLREMILEGYRESFCTNGCSQHDSMNEETSAEVGVGVANQNAETVLRIAAIKEVVGGEGVPILFQNEEKNATPMQISLSDDENMPEADSAVVYTTSEAPGRSLATSTSEGHLPSTSAQVPGSSRSMLTFSTPIDRKIVKTIQQEATAAAAKAEQGFESDDDDIFIMPGGKRRQVIEGVELFQWQGPTGGDYSVSECNITQPITKRCTKGDTPSYLKNKDSTTGKKKYDSPPPSLKLQCDICNEIFTTRELHEEHKKLHPAQECDSLLPQTKVNASKTATQRSPKGI